MEEIVYIKKFLIREGFLVFIEGKSIKFLDDCYYFVFLVFYLVLCKDKYLINVGYCC